MRIAPELYLKRLVVGGDAPRAVCWGRTDRAVLVRVPGYRPNVESACRVELRSPDPACNPYVAFAAVLCAGLRGIQDQLPLGEPYNGPALGQMSAQDMRAAGLQPLPENLGQAIELFEGSALMREVLGDHVHGHLVELKRSEWDSYQRAVSAWELDNYLEVL